MLQFLLYFSGHGFASSKGSPHVVGTDANAPGAQAVNLKKDFVVPLDKCCDGAAIVLLVDACMVSPEAFADDRERTTRLNGACLMFLSVPHGAQRSVVLLRQVFRCLCAPASTLRCRVAVLRQPDSVTSWGVPVRNVVIISIGLWPGTDTLETCFLITSKVELSSGGNCSFSGVIRTSATVIGLRMYALAARPCGG